MTGGSANLAGQVYAELAEWSRQFEAGQLTDPAAGPGERFGIRIPDAAGVDLAIVREGPKVTAVHAEGDVVATDRRLMVVRGAKILYSWSWAADVERAVGLQDGLGVGLMPSPERFAEGRRGQGVVTSLLLKRRTPSRAATVPLLFRWGQVVGAWRASKGELGDWLGGMQELIG